MCIDDDDGDWDADIVGLVRILALRGIIEVEICESRTIFFFLHHKSLEISIHFPTVRLSSIRYFHHSETIMQASRLAQNSCGLYGMSDSKFTSRWIIVRFSNFYIGLVRSGLTPTLSTQSLVITLTVSAYAINAYQPKTSVD